MGGFLDVARSLARPALSHLRHHGNGGMVRSCGGATEAEAEAAAVRMNLLAGGMPCPVDPKVERCASLTQLHVTCAVFPPCNRGRDQASRDGAGAIVADPVRFPAGIKARAVHTKDNKAGGADFLLSLASPHALCRGHAWGCIACDVRRNNRTRVGRRSGDVERLFFGVRRPSATTRTRRGYTSASTRRSRASRARRGRGRTSTRSRTRRRT